MSTMTNKRLNKENVTNNLMFDQYMLKYKHERLNRNTAKFIEIIKMSEHDNEIKDQLEQLLALYYLKKK